MRDIGKITNIDNGLAYIKLEKGEKCGSCNLCSAGKMKHEISALNDNNYETGDKVVVEIKSKTVLTFTFFVYIFPLLAAIIGYTLLFYLFDKKELAGIIGAFTFLSVCLTLVCLYNKKNKGKIESRIIEKLN